MRKKQILSGLRRRNGVWHIEKMVNGTRLYESTGVSEKSEAEKILMYRLGQLRAAKVFGVRPQRTFQEAATRYLIENQQKLTLVQDANEIEGLMPFLSYCTLDQLDSVSLQPYISWRQKQGVKNRTINRSLRLIGRILNLAHRKWRGEFGLTWLREVPHIPLLPLMDSRKPYPLSWEEQDQLLALLPDYLRRMALFKINTGLRDQEVCQLQWEWERHIPELKSSLFVIPGTYTHHGLDRWVFLNDIARQVIAEVRHRHPVYVFTRGDGLTRVCQMSNKAWKKAHNQLNLPVRVQDLKFTFEHRLRMANVSLEDRQDLLGLKSSRIIRSDDFAKIKHLIDLANKVYCK